MIEPHHNDHQIATYWCQKCQIPTTEMMCSICGIDTKRLITSGRLRPVFADEIEIMEALIGTKLLDRPSDFVFWRSGRDYYAAGRKVFHVECELCDDDWGHFSVNGPYGSFAVSAFPRCGYVYVVFDNCNTKKKMQSVAAPHQNFYTWHPHFGLGYRLPIYLDEIQLQSPTDKDGIIGITT